MIYDIKTPDSACQFVQDFFNVSASEFINQYSNKCQNDFELFWDWNLEYINSTDISKLKYTVFHITSSVDNCNDIRRDGLKNLQAVLSEENRLTSLLSEYGVKIDVQKRELLVGNKTFSIDINKSNLQNQLPEKKIQEIRRRLCREPEVEGYFANTRVKDSQFHRRPEFLFNLGECLPVLKKAEDYWTKNSKGYIITFLADLNQFAWHTFYRHEDECLDDQQNRLRLKKELISRAIDRSFDSANSFSEIPAYMKTATVIKPEQIISYKLID